MKNNYKIYYLADPRDNVIRYIGCTGKTLSTRLTGHISTCKTHSFTYHSMNWIRSLLNVNIFPIINLIEDNLSLEQAEQAEIFYIKTFRAIGYKLTNSTDGGTGIRGHIPSTETRLKMSLAASTRPRAPLSNKTKQKISLAHIGKSVSQATKNKLSKHFKGVPTGFRGTDETRKRLSEKTRLQVGERNSSFKTFWINNGIRNKRVHNILPNGWSIGRTTGKRKVQQINTKDNSIIKVFDSMSDAVRLTGANISCICNCISGGRNTAGGFKWKYQD